MGGNCTSERETIPPTFLENVPFCQAVVRGAAFAGVAKPMATARTGAGERAAAAASIRHRPIEGMYVLRLKA